MSTTLNKIANETTARMERAFALVCPATRARELAARGLISAADAAAVSWKDRIVCLVTDDELAAAGVTIGEVADAIAFYTATDAAITREPQIGSLPWVSFLNGGVPGFFVAATGYRRGPAGDH